MQKPVKVLVILVVMLVSLLAVSGLLVVLPFRQHGATHGWRLFLSVAAFALAVGWVLLSILAIPRAVAAIARRQQTGTAVTLLVTACVPVLLAIGLVVASTFWTVGRGDGRKRVESRRALTPAQIVLREELRRDVAVLGGEIGPRSAVTEYTNLCRAAEFIEKSLSGMGYEVRRQDYEPDHWAMRGKPCRNLEVEIKGTAKPDEIVVVGAHYDTEMSCPGANDNGSGMAALLALARRFPGKGGARTLRFVAFANEEPPFFWTSQMGSLVYATACRARGDKIVAMLSLETLGYYDDAPGSQHYPSRLFGWLYPTTGNFISFIGNVKSRALVERALLSFRRHAVFPSEGAALPGLISGVGWSDHWAFWQNGYPGVMVTDTAPFRYAHYHTAEDTPEKLDYDRFAVVVEGLLGVVGEIQSEGAVR